MRHASPGAIFFVVDFYIGIYDFAARNYALVHESRPLRLRFAPEYALAVERKGRRAVFSARHDVFAHDRIYRVAVQRRFELEQFSDVFVAHDVVRVQPHDIFLRRFGEREVARRGEVVAPLEIENIPGVALADALGSVARSGVRDNYFVREFFGAGKASAYHAFLVSDYHA